MHFQALIKGRKKTLSCAITALSAYILLAFIAVAMCGKLQMAQMGSDTPLFLALRCLPTVIYCYTAFIAVAMYGTVVTVYQQMGLWLCVVIWSIPASLVRMADSSEC